MAGIITVPLHIGDFLSGTLHMDTLEKGAYIMLMLAHYQVGHDGLPNDDTKLARIAGVSPTVWKRIKPIILEKFEVAGEFLVSSRCQKVLRGIEEKSLAQRAKALKKHEAGHAVAEPETCQPKPKPKPKDKSKDLSAIEFENDFWPSAEKKVGKDAASKAFAKARERAALEEILPAWRAMNSQWAAKKHTPDWQYVPHPATWLSEGRWQDEVEKPRSQGVHFL